MVLNVEIATRVTENLHVNPVEGIRLQYVAQEINNFLTPLLFSRLVLIPKLEANE